MLCAQYAAYGIIINEIIKFVTCTLLELANFEHRRFTIADHVLIIKILYWAYEVCERKKKFIKKCIRKVYKKN